MLLHWGWLLPKCRRYAAFSRQHRHLESFVQLYQYVAAIRLFLGYIRTWSLLPDDGVFGTTRHFLKGIPSFLTNSPPRPTLNIFLPQLLLSQQ